ncbi:MAG: 3-hydroxyacyl-CoA dehydrogenase NAD-binding domain-containing protein [Clostridia bacterium]|nr:3-hydroxyacyl-CoA dehydrogenase NAD-binding domain-containing protein [Clostridia bacterium]
MLNIAVQEARRTKVAVFGLGFVGLPLALSFAMRGCKVLGVDINNALVTELNNGVTHHLEFYGQTPIQQILAEQLAKGNFIATTDASEAMAECDNVIVTVGIPVEDGEHYTGHLEDCIRAVPSKYDFTADTLEEAVDGAHGILVLARQKEIAYNDFTLFKNKMSRAGTSFIVDTRNLYLRSRVEEAGMVLESL